MKDSKYCTRFFVGFLVWFSNFACGQVHQPFDDDLSADQQASGTDSLVFWPTSDPLLKTAFPNALARVQTVLTQRGEDNRPRLESKARSRGFFRDWHLGSVATNIVSLDPTVVTLQLYAEANYVVKTVDGGESFSLIENRQVKCTNCSGRERARRLKESCDLRALELERSTRAFVYYGRLQGEPAFSHKKDGHDYFAQNCHIKRFATQKCLHNHTDQENPDCVYITTPQSESFNRIVTCQLRARA